MNQFRPHDPSPTFEGYYSKFDLPSGAYIALVMCSVPKSNHQPHMVSFTYVPSDFPDTPVFQREIFLDGIKMINTPTSPSNEDTSPTIIVLAPEVGQMTVTLDSTTTYKLHDPEGTFTFTATIYGPSRTPWLRQSPDSTPEGLLVHLPLPLHWHVHSLASDCAVSLNVPSKIYPHIHESDQSDSSVSAKVHQEKNWAHSFPASHIWIQCRNADTNTGLNVAGGSIIGTDAYLVTYHARDPRNDISFAPPYSMTPSLLPSLSPTMSVSHSWTNRSVDLCLLNLTRKIEIHAHAPKGTFFGLSAPFKDGHRDNFLGQSFRTTVSVKVYKASHLGFGHWELVCEETFERASLEFGGDAYEDKNKGKNKSENGGEAWIS